MLYNMIRSDLICSQDSFSCDLLNIGYRINRLFFIQNVTNKINHQEKEVENKKDVYMKFECSTYTDLLSYIDWDTNIFLYSKYLYGSLFLFLSRVNDQKKFLFGVIKICCQFYWVV